MEEVRGVQTRKTSDGDFEFTNENDFSVSVEAKLYYGNSEYIVGGITLRDIINFNLKAGEKYHWYTNVSANYYPYIKYRAWKFK